MDLVNLGLNTVVYCRKTHVHRAGLLGPYSLTLFQTSVSILDFTALRKTCIFFACLVYSTLPIDIAEFRFRNKFAR